MQGNYTISVKCSNCNYTNTEEKPKGELLNDRLNNECPNCGCKTLIEQPLKG